MSYKHVKAERKEFGFCVIPSIYPTHYQDLVSFNLDQLQSPLYTCCIRVIYPGNKLFLIAVKSLERKHVSKDKNCIVYSVEYLFSHLLQDNKSIITVLLYKLRELAGNRRMDE